MHIEKDKYPQKRLPTNSLLTISQAYYTTTVNKTNKNTASHNPSLNQMHRSTNFNFMKENTDKVIQVTVWTIWIV